MDKKPCTERRAALELRAAGKDKLIGYAAVFDSASRDLGGFVEFVRPGAFRRSLASGADVVALVSHDNSLILGRRGAGTLQLSEDAKGLRFEIDVPPTTAARDLMVSVERGDVAGASFAFMIPEARGQRWDFKAKPAVRELLDVELIDVTVTGQPAYPDTTVALRTLRAENLPHIGRTLARAYVETL